MDSEGIINIPDDPVRKSSGGVFVPKWEVVDFDTMYFASTEKHRYINIELFQAFELIADRSRFEDSSVDHSFAMSANLFTKVYIYI